MNEFLWPVTSIKRDWSNIIYIRRQNFDVIKNQLKIWKITFYVKVPNLNLSPSFYVSNKSTNLDNVIKVLDTSSPNGELTITF